MCMRLVNDLGYNINMWRKLSRTPSPIILDRYYVAYKPNHIFMYFFMFIEMKFMFIVILI